jgi:16S rRNA (guanine527-N7)-methyltransferase
VVTDADDFSAALNTALAGLGLAVAPAQVETLRAHFDLILDANTRFNLTRITDPGEAAVRLYADSAAVLVWADRERARVRTVLDVGTGAGFPAVPLAVLAPHWQVTGLDSTSKKAAFVDFVAHTLGIGNLRAVHAHSDHWVPEPKFDLLTFKAIGSLDNCLTTAQGLVADGGHVVVFKSAGTSSDELAAGRSAAGRLGFTLLAGFDYALPAPGKTATFTLHAYVRGQT